MLAPHYPLHTLCTPSAHCSRAPSPTALTRARPPTDTNQQMMTALAPTTIPATPAKGLARKLLCAIRVGSPRHSMLTFVLLLLQLSGTVAQCTDSCVFKYDGQCDDGGPGNVYNFCSLGTDCRDCGPRFLSSPAPPPPPPPSLPDWFKGPTTPKTQLAVAWVVTLFFCLCCSCFAGISMNPDPDGSRDGEGIALYLQWSCLLGLSFLICVTVWGVLMGMKPPRMLPPSPSPPTPLVPPSPPLVPPPPPPKGRPAPSMPSEACRRPPRCRPAAR